MLSNANVRGYRPRYTPVNVHCRSTEERVQPLLSRGDRKLLSIFAVVAVVLGLGITQFFSSQISDSRARGEQVQALNREIGNENIRLLAVRAQLSSKAHIVSLAQSRMHLYEPEKGQVTAVRM